MSQPIITVIGSSNTDLVVRVPRIPAPGETLLGHDMQRVPGGKGANQAIAASRVGVMVHFVGCLGDDDFGDVAAMTLAREGLHLEHLVRVAGVPSGVALIAVAPTGENSIIVAAGANAHLSAVDIDRATPAIQTADLVIAQLEIPLATVQHAFMLARQFSIRTLLNPAPAQALPDALLSLADVLVCNETEAATLTGMAVTDRAAAITVARRLRERGPALVIVTLGGDGCLVASDDAVTHIPAFIVPVVDTTAAGDAFIGALAYRLVLGDMPTTAAHYAAAAAALSVGVAGAQPSLPTGDQVALFLSRLAPERT